VGLQALHPGQAGGDGGQGAGAGLGAPAGLSVRVERVVALRPGQDLWRLAALAGAGDGDGDGDGDGEDDAMPLVLTLRAWVEDVESAD
jgi:hypothetical protein